MLMQNMQEKATLEKVETQFLLIISYKLNWRSEVEQDK